jgi:feruloyl esterase
MREMGQDECSLSAMLVDLGRSMWSFPTEGKAIHSRALYEHQSAFRCPSNYSLIMNRRSLLFIVLLGAASLPKTLQAESCAGLKGAFDPSIGLVAEEISSGIFTPPQTAQRISNLPAFCRITATLRPTPDSIIGVETWLPLSGWNGKYMAEGSGGWGGSIAYDAMAEALRRGYAASATDDGHIGGSGIFAMGHPEKLRDFAYRAQHEMTSQSKALIHAFYGRQPRYSYWNGCSGGGREGLIQAARYPDEFDGVIAGDPADIRRNSWALWLANETFKDPASVIPAAKYPMIHKAVLDACDANDGVKDGLIDDPRSCRVDFKALACKSGDRSDCLTPPQVQTAQIMISPAIDSNGQVLFPRVEPGTELRWDRLAGGPAPADLFQDEFRYVVYEDPNWKWRTFDLTRDSAKAHKADQGIDEIDPDLTAFVQHHGKLILYHGWADQQVAPGSSINFYNAALNKVGGEQQNSDWIRLFMVPGMGHCGGGEGPNEFDKITLIEDWVEKGEAPSRVIASHRTNGQADRTRPLCAYPQRAKYKGTGSIDDAANFTCTLIEQ